MTPRSAPLTVKKSPIHGKGVFATRTVKKGTRIGTFEGKRTKRDGTYVLWVQEGEDEYGIRGENELRFLNHSSRPNAELDGVELVARRAIREGDEVTISYGPDWD